MWPYVDPSRDGLALKHASTIGAALSAPFVHVPSAASEDAVARHRWAPEEPHDPSNDDHVHPHGPFGWLVHGIRSWAARRDLENTLLAMDEHQLADIGLTRGDIAEVVAGRYRRPVLR
jgi:uncharacterized protein YjiS (DUF1127 family)